MSRDVGKLSLNRVVHLKGVTLFCLFGLLVCLLAVGVESETFLRHLFQVTPIVLVIAIGLLKSRWFRSGAFGLFACWAFFMVLIWLYLVGVQTLFTGNFTVFEIVLTVVMGGLCIIGVVVNTRPDPTVGWPMHVVISIAFTLCQLVVMWLSLFVHRLGAIP